MAVAAGIEPTTCSLGESRSIQLSYATARFFLSRRIRKQHSDERPNFVVGRCRALTALSGP